MKLKRLQNAVLWSMDLGINRYGNTCTYMEAEYLQKEENSYHIWLSCLVFLFGLNRDLSKFFHASISCHDMWQKEQNCIYHIIYNKCPTGYTIKLRYTDAWYDYVIKGRCVCLWTYSCIQNCLQYNRQEHYKSAVDPITVAPSGWVLKQIGILTAINKTRLLHVKRCKNKCSERFLVIFKLIMRQIKT